MANTEKLGKEFDDFLSKMTDEDWHRWRAHLSENRVARRAKMQEEMNKHIEKLKEKK